MKTVALALACCAVTYGATAKLTAFKPGTFNCTTTVDYGPTAAYGSTIQATWSAGYWMADVSGATGTTLHYRMNICGQAGADQAITLGSDDPPNAWTGKYDSYGGAVMRYPFGHATGYFHFEKKLLNGKTRLIMVDPTGNPLWLKTSANPMRASYVTGVLNSKYGGDSAKWGSANAQRAKAWGLNGWGSYTGTSEVIPVGSGIAATRQASPKLPFFITFANTNYARYGAGGALPCAAAYPNTGVLNILSGVPAVFGGGAGGATQTLWGMTPDVFSPSYGKCIDNVVRTAFEPYVNTSAKFATPDFAAGATRTSQWRPFGKVTRTSTMTTLSFDYSNGTWSRPWSAGDWVWVDSRCDATLEGLYQLVAGGGSAGSVYYYQPGKAAIATGTVCSGEVHEASAASFPPALSVQSVATGQTATTITTKTPHGLQNGQKVLIWGASGTTATSWAVLNGYQTVTVTGSNTFTIAKDTSAVSGNFDGKIAASTGRTYGCKNLNCAPQWVLGIIMDEPDYLAGFRMTGATGFPSRHHHPGFVAAVAKPNYTTAEGCPAEWDCKLYSKYAWADFLRKRYGTIGALNSAWNTGGYYTTFDSDGGWGPAGKGVLDEDGSHAQWWGNQDGKQPYELNNMNATLRKDLEDFVYLFTRKYSETVVREIRKYDSVHLIFGPDFLNNWGQTTWDGVALGLIDGGVDVYFAQLDTCGAGCTITTGPWAGSMNGNKYTYDLIATDTRMGRTPRQVPFLIWAGGESHQDGWWYWADGSSKTTIGPLKLGTGNGAQKSFSGTAAYHYPMHKAGECADCAVSVTTTVGGVTATLNDDGAGHLTGSQGSGTYNTGTGSIAVTFTTPPDNAAAVTAKYRGASLPSTFAVFPTQASKGTAYGNNLAVLYNAQGSDGVYYVLGQDWWMWMDNSTREPVNWGFVSQLDNAYDGVEAVSSGVPCGNGTESLRVTTTTCGGEPVNFGNSISAIQAAHAAADRAVLGDSSGGQ